MSRSVTQATRFMVLQEARVRGAGHGEHEAPLEAPVPDPGFTVEQMAQQLADDPEFRAWREAEIRGTIGRR